MNIYNFKQYIRRIINNDCKAFITLIFYVKFKKQKEQYV